MSGQQEAATPGRQKPQHTGTDCMQKCSQVPCDGCRARRDVLTHAARAEHPGEGSCGLHRWDKEHYRGGRFAAAGSEFTSERNKCAGARLHSPGKSLMVPRLICLDRLGTWAVTGLLLQLLGATMA